ncbi:MAG: hypothetical protein IJC74_02690 [Clostridia bacterium]|nr:hypothetical protein [Clostridia bacterium]
MNNSKNNKNKNSKAQKKGMEVAKEFISKDSLKFDPNGSYTGKTKNKYEEPVQDADDL